MPPPGWLPAWWLDFWGWLAREHQTLAGLGALATAGGVLVAAIYAALTWRLAQQAKRQAEASRAQATVTQQMFEAAYRPYLDILLSGGGAYTSPETYYFAMIFRVYGQVPAVLISWRAVIRTPDGAEPVSRVSPTDLRDYIVPGGQTPPIVLQGPTPGPAPRDRPDVTLQITVTYRGVGDSRYQSHAIFRQTATTTWTLVEQWFTWHWVRDR